jgi:hypothetical protein
VSGLAVFEKISQVLHLLSTNLLVNFFSFELFRYDIEPFIMVQSMPTVFLLF